MMDEKSEEKFEEMGGQAFGSIDQGDRGGFLSDIDTENEASTNASAGQQEFTNYQAVTEHDEEPDDFFEQDGDHDRGESIEHDAKAEDIEPNMGAEFIIGSENEPEAGHETFAENPGETEEYASPVATENETKIISQEPIAGGNEVALPNGINHAAIAHSGHVDPEVVDLLMRWKSLSVVQRASFTSLTREVNVLSELIETNTNSLSEKFSALVDATQKQTEFIQTIVTSAQEMSSGSSETSLPSVMKYLEATLSDGIAKIVALSKQCVQMVYELQDVVKLVGETEGMIKKINAINKKANLVALNAKIESSRAGAAGAGFSVVADEMRDMSNLVDAVASEMSEKMGTITSGIMHGYESLKEVANIDLSENIAAKDRIDGMMSGILEYNRDFGQKLEESAKSSAEVSHQISGLITGFQFQDRASQYMAAINDSLRLLTQFSIELENVTSQSFPAAELKDDTQAKLWMSQILDSLTLGDVRNRFLDSIAEESNLALDEESGAVDKLANEAADDDDDIELF